MRNLIRRFLESLLYAGLKPDAPARSASPPPGHQGQLRAKLERLLFRGLKPDQGPMQPMSRKRKIVLAVLGVLGCLLVAGLVFALMNRKPPSEMSATADPAPLNFLPPDLKIEKNRYLEVVEIEFQTKSPPYEIIGTLKNLTAKRVSAAEISFDLTDEGGSRVGAVTTTVQNVDPMGSVRFHIPVTQKNAAFAIVRDLRAL